jgi:hypothetical protein
VGVGERTLAPERCSVFGQGEGLSCCCEGPASVVACVAAEEPSLILQHLCTFFLNPSSVLERLNWPNSHHGASAAPMIIDFRVLYLRFLHPVRAIKSETTMSTNHTSRPM